MYCFAVLSLRYWLALTTHDGNDTLTRQVSATLQQIETIGYHEQPRARFRRYMNIPISSENTLLKP